MRTSIAAAFLLFSGAAVAADDPDPLTQWPQWRGPLGNGMAPKRDPPIDWRLTRNIRRTGETPGSGHAAAGKILVASFGARGIFCFDRDGNEKWKRDLGNMKIKVGFGEGISPVLAGDAVLVNRDHEGGSFIVRLDARTGEEKWRRARD